MCNYNDNDSWSTESYDDPAFLRQHVIMLNWDRADYLRIGHSGPGQPCIICGDSATHFNKVLMYRLDDRDVSDGSEAVTPTFGLFTIPLCKTHNIVIQRGVHEHYEELSQIRKYTRQFGGVGREWLRPEVVLKKHIDDGWLPLFGAGVSPFGSRDSTRWFRNDIGWDIRDIMGDVSEERFMELIRQEFPLILGGLLDAYSETVIHHSTHRNTEQAQEEADELYHQNANAFRCYFCGSESTEPVLALLEKDYGWFQASRMYRVVATPFCYECGKNYINKRVNELKTLRPSTSFSLLNVMVGVGIVIAWLLALILASQIYIDAPWGQTLRIAAVAGIPLVTFFIAMFVHASIEGRRISIIDFIPWKKSFEFAFEGYLSEIMRTGWYRVTTIQFHEWNSTAKVKQFFSDYQKCTNAAPVVLLDISGEVFI